MALNINQVCSVASIPNDLSDDMFYSIIDRLKIQKALPRDSFAKEMPFFNFSSISKEAQIRELFQDISDPNTYKSLVKNIVSLPEEKNSDFISKRLAAMQVLGFAQIILYKVLPCCDNCPNRPREIATHNQYKDYEYECPFYHHDKDKRRMVLSPNIDEEFVYKANYYEEGKRMVGEKDKYSQNYFESMFHPLYYKMFRCKREYCNFSQFCPFYHSEEEKKIWDRVFSNFIRKDRITYVKDKQKYYENAIQPKNTETRFLRAGSDHIANKENYSTNTFGSPSSNYNYKRNHKPKTPKYQTQNSPNSQGFNEWKSQKPFKANSARKLDVQNQSPISTKDSEGSPNINSSPVSFDYFSDQKEVLANHIC